MKKNITFYELFSYIKKNSDGDYNLLSYLDGFIKNMLVNSLYVALFSWSESEIFHIEINEDKKPFTFNVYRLNK